MFWGGLLAGISEVGAAVLEVVEIALLVVGDVPFPAGKKDADAPTSWTSIRTIG